MYSFLSSVCWSAIDASACKSNIYWLSQDYQLIESNRRDYKIDS